MSVVCICDLSLMDMGIEDIRRYSYISKITMICVLPLPCDRPYRTGSMSWLVCHTGEFSQDTYVRDLCLRRKSSRWVASLRSITRADGDDACVAATSWISAGSLTSFVAGRLLSDRKYTTVRLYMNSKIGRASCRERVYVLV